MKKAGIIAVVALVAVASFARENLITIEKLLSAPFPSGLTASPSGAKFAWVQNAQGVRNIWIAEPPEYRGRQLTNYTRDEGVELGSIRWSPDAGTIVFVRGGRANSSNEIPNPAMPMPALPAGLRVVLGEAAIVEQAFVTKALTYQRDLLRRELLLHQTHLQLLLGPPPILQELDRGLIAVL